MREVAGSIAPKDMRVGATEFVANVCFVGPSPADGVEIVSGSPSPHVDRHPGLPPPDRRSVVTMLLASASSTVITSVGASARATDLLVDRDQVTAAPAGPVPPRLADSFLAWLNEARGRFARAIIIERCTDTGVEFSFDVGRSILSGWINDYELVISVDHDGTCWDLIACFEACPERSGAGYVCSDCFPDARTLFASPDALWTDHIFDPFLTWVNEKLAPASAIALIGSEGCSTAAWLISPGIVEKGEHQLIELRAGPRPEYRSELPPRSVA